MLPNARIHTIDRAITCLCPPLLQIIWEYAVLSLEEKLWMWLHAQQTKQFNIGDVCVKWNRTIPHKFMRCPMFRLEFQERNITRFQIWPMEQLMDSSNHDRHPFTFVSDNKWRLACEQWRQSIDAIE